MMDNMDYEHDGNSSNQGSNDGYGEEQEEGELIAEEGAESSPSSSSSKEGSQQQQGDQGEQGEGQALTALEQRLQALPFFSTFDPDRIPDDEAKTGMHPLSFFLSFIHSFIHSFFLLSLSLYIYILIYIPSPLNKITLIK